MALVMCCEVWKFLALALDPAMLCLMAACSWPPCVPVTAIAKVALPFAAGARDVVFVGSDVLEKNAVSGTAIRSFAECVVAHCFHLPR